MDIIGEALDSDRNKLLATMRRAFDPEHLNSNLKDFNDNISLGVNDLSDYLINNDPDNLKAQNKTINLPLTTNNSPINKQHPSQLLFSESKPQ